MFTIDTGFSIDLKQNYSFKEKGLSIVLVCHTGTCKLEHIIPIFPRLFYSTILIIFTVYS